MADKTEPKVSDCWSCARDTMTGDGCLICGAPYASNEISEIVRAFESESELRDLCNAVFRIGWDRDLAAVKRHAEDIIARMDMTTDAPLEARSIT